MSSQDPAHILARKNSKRGVVEQSRTAPNPGGNNTERWRWLGHTLRKPRNSITRQSLQWNPQGKRSRVRPRTTWRRNLEEEMKASGHSWRDITRMAQDRREWGTVVRGLYPLQGEWL
ncbi:hypothetical protein RRG08_002967 [Elysia crispata]|uniref:Uncharacterized protein n=1 Tax=Elysia crispata TaxID=231223 RepID=A0AAE1AND7_9GAST|nr:hypothetical protein RRG08_002967 [Elysia crispata]